MPTELSKVAHANPFPLLLSSLSKCLNPFSLGSVFDHGKGFQRSYPTLRPRKPEELQLFGVQGSSFLATPYLLLQAIFLLTLCF